MGYSTDDMIAQIIRCARHQNEQISVPDGIPIGAPESFNVGECLPEESMGNASPTIPCDVESPLVIFEHRRPSIVTEYDGSWS